MIKTKELPSSILACMELGVSLDFFFFCSCYCYKYRYCYPIIIIIIIVHFILLITITPFSLRNHYSYHYLLIIWKSMLPAVGALHSKCDGVTIMVWKCNVIFLGKNSHSYHKSRRILGTIINQLLLYIICIVVLIEFLLLHIHFHFVYDFI